MGLVAGIRVKGNVLSDLLNKILESGNLPFVGSLCFQLFQSINAMVLEIGAGKHMSAPAAIFQNLQKFVFDSTEFGQWQLARGFALFHQITCKMSRWYCSTFSGIVNL